MSARLPGELPPNSGLLQCSPPAMSESEQKPQEVATTFKKLLDKAHQLFAGLRDLPQFGKASWQAYFQRTFALFTKVRSR